LRYPFYQIYFNPSSLYNFSLESLLTNVYLFCIH
jgi:hypothetical protein